MLVAGLLVVVLHRHRWNHLADLQRSSVIGRGGRERERERAMDRENVSGDARGLEADIKDWKAAGLVGGGGSASTCIRLEAGRSGGSDGRTCSWQRVLCKNDSRSCSVRS